MNRARQHTLKAAFIRFTALLGLWCVLDSITVGGLALGAGAAGLATWASLRLMPPTRGRLRVLPLFSLGIHFLRSSIVAGFDVAWRAFHPRMRLRPGLVTCECGLPTGVRRDILLGMISLTPGSVVAGEEDGRVVVHCLDTGDAVAAQFADNEARLIRALEGAPDA